MKAFVNSRAQVAARPLAFAQIADLVAILLLLLLLLAVLPLRYDAFPMLVWDEARNATNALEMALSDNWLVPTYGGEPDHWNTKPPLLIWAVAGFLKLGLPPLLALRLPSTLAALATVMLLWAFCRHVLQDRVAAFLTGLLVLTSVLYIGPHAARTGDYDTLQSLFILGYVLAFWMALRPGTAHRTQWLLATGAGILLAVLTKGIAGGLGLPGLLAYAILRGQLWSLLRDWRLWAIGLGTLALSLGYYLTRDFYDPGYSAAVWYNELGGRFTEQLDGHGGGAGFYLYILARGFQPGLLLLPLAALCLRARADSQRRSVVILALATAFLLGLAMTMTATKLHWYAVPLVPLLALAAALGTADMLRWLAQRPAPPLHGGAQAGIMPWLLRPAILRPTLAMLLLAGVSVALWRNQFRTPEWTRQAGNEQLWYASVLETASLDHPGEPVLALESGIGNAAGLVHYNPILRFYTLWAGHQGQSVQIAAPGEAPLPAGRLVATCDPISRAWLRDNRPLVVLSDTPQCLLGRVP